MAATTTYHHRTEFPGLLWRIDHELGLIEVRAGGEWFPSQLDMHNAEHNIRSGEWAEVPAP